MLSRIVQLSLRHAGALVVLVALLLLVGMQQLKQARFDVFPEFAPAVFTVQVEAPGLAAEQVETLVTRPLESLLNGANGVADIRSESMQGLSVIRVGFGAGDPFRQRQTVVDQVGGAAGVLPPGTGAPTVSPLTSSTMDLLKIGFVSDSRSAMELRDFVQWTVRPRLLAVPGVARVAVYGGAQRELVVRLRPEVLAVHGIALGDIGNALRDLAAVRGLGFEDSGSQRLAVQTASAAIDAEALGETLISSKPGQPIRLADVAAIAAEPGAPFGDALINGNPGVLVALASQYGANTLSVTQDVETALAELKPLLDREHITLVPALHRPANFIESALSHLTDSLLIGAALTFVLLLLVLRSPRTALISFLSIPLSLLAAVAVLQAFGVSLNTMTLGGLAVAIGVVVDDAVIDVENIARRLRQRAAGSQLRDVVFAASMEVRMPVVFATAVVMLVFLPILALSGLQGAFFRPLAMAFLLAVGASLLVALTVTPALCLLLLKAHPAEEPRWLHRLQSAQTRMLGGLSNHFRTALLLSAVLALAACAALALFGRQLLPVFKEGHVVAQITAPPDTGLAAMRALGQRMSRDILAIPAVQSVELQMGRAEAAEDTWGVNRGEFHIALKPVTASEESAATEQIRTVVDSQPGVTSDVTTFLGDRIGEAISGETAAVVITLFGNDLDALDAAAHRVADELSLLPTAADVQLRVPERAPALVVTPRPNAMALYGIRPGDIADAVQAAHQGLRATQVFAGDRITPVTLRLVGDAAPSLDSLKQLPVRGAAGPVVSLSQLADLKVEDSRPVVEHQAALRRQVVTVNPDTRDIAGFVRAAEAALAQKPLPPGVTMNIDGAAQAQQRATRELARNSLVALVLMGLLLTVGLGDIRRATLVLLTAPFALVGGAIAVAASGGVLSLGSLVGLVTLFGIAARNAILLLSHLDHLVLHEGAPWTLDTALRAARERLLPVLLTALLAALGLLPVALSAGTAGQEIEGPMAIVILGGLASSTLLCLMLLPLLAMRFLRPPLGERQPSTMPMETAHD